MTKIEGRRNTKIDLVRVCIHEGREGGWLSRSVVMPANTYISLLWLHYIICCLDWTSIFSEEKCMVDVKS